LVQFGNATGKTRDIARLPETPVHEFCQKGAKLISSNGEIWDVSAGVVCDSVASSSQESL
jgi:hypothetical protein